MEINKEEVFSYHLLEFPLGFALRQLTNPPNANNTHGLNYSLTLFTMSLGIPILSMTRYKLNTIALVAWWKNEAALNDFMDNSDLFKNSRSAWNLKMKSYRRWGSFTEINQAHLFQNETPPTGPIAALTLAKLKISQTLRFEKWGRPVEKQVANHQGQKLAVVAMRPMTTFSTFSLWKNEQEMLNMIHAKQAQKDGQEHQAAMKERSRKQFHHEFATLRFKPISESGTYGGRKNILDL